MHPPGAEYKKCVLPEFILNAHKLKDRHQWLGREFRGSLSLIMDKLFLKAIIHELYH